MRFVQHLVVIALLFIHQSAAQKLLLLFLDGFRWDYIKDTELIGFIELKKNGVYIRKVIPVFPADCHPNIYSIFTGLYPEHHGVIGNKVYSAVNQEEFDHNSAVHRRDVHRWVDAEPLWVTSKKQGKQSFLYHLPICESSFDPLSPTFCVPYHFDYMTMDSFNRSVHEALRALRTGAAEMAVVYNDQLDRLTHSYGPQSARLTQRLLPAIDSIIQWLLAAVAQSEVHLVVLSDHGMAQIAKDRQIFLERIILRSDIERVVNQGGYVGIWPRKGSYNKVHYQLLIAVQDPNRHFQLYTHDSMPPEWNAYGRHDLSPPLLIVADPGYFISSNELQYPSGDDFYDSGWHGYAPEHEEMASPLLAYGPRVRQGTHLSIAHVTDVYQLLAHLLGVVPQFHNGSSTFLAEVAHLPDSGTRLQAAIVPIVDSPAVTPAAGSLSSSTSRPVASPGVHVCWLLVTVVLHTSYCACTLSP